MLLDHPGPGRGAFLKNIEYCYLVSPDLSPAQAEALAAGDWINCRNEKFKLCIGGESAYRRSGETSTIQFDEAHRGPGKNVLVLFS